MAKVEIKKLDVLSVSKIYAVIGAIVGFIAGLFIAVFAGIASAVGGMTGLQGAGFGIASMGILAIVAAPIIYGIMGFVCGAIGAFIYNIVAAKIGGIVFES
jgi:hypothetical protein